MIQSSDVGSLPHKNSDMKLLEGVSPSEAEFKEPSFRFLDSTIAEVFIDKLKAGISIPAYPQFRDMNTMFLSHLEGVEHTEEGYVETRRMTLNHRDEGLFEVAAIRRNAERIRQCVDSPFQLRVCITGPYTLGSFFPYRNSQTYHSLGQMLSTIVDRSIFNLKSGRVGLVSIDEPLFGVVDDPLLERGTEGREMVQAAWESISSKAKAKKVETCIHLHNTSDTLFWDVESLRIIESHFGDPLFEMETTKDLLEKEDKQLKASIAISDFDRLIKSGLRSSSMDDVAKAWRGISQGTMAPEIFLERGSVMKKRLEKTVGQFGSERVAIAGPECGLRGFPTYHSALECLRRVSHTCQSFS